MALLFLRCSKSHSNGQCVGKKNKLKCQKEESAKKTLEVKKKWYDPKQTLFLFPKKQQHDTFLKMQVYIQWYVFDGEI